MPTFKNNENTTLLFTIHILLSATHNEQQTFNYNESRNSQHKY